MGSIGTTSRSERRGKWQADRKAIQVWWIEETRKTVSMAVTWQTTVNVQAEPSILGSSVDCRKE